MSFNIEELRTELEKYGTIIDCTVYHTTNLEVRFTNETGTCAIFNNIETTMILPYFPTKLDHICNSTYYKCAFRV